MQLIFEGHLSPSVLGGRHLPTLRKYTLADSPSLPTPYFAFQYEHPTAPIPTKAWKAATSPSLASSYTQWGATGLRYMPKCPLLLVLAWSLSGLPLHNLTPLPPPYSSLLTKHVGISCNTFFFKKNNLLNPEIALSQQHSQLRHTLGECKAFTLGGGMGSTILFGGTSVIINGLKFKVSFSKYWCCPFTALSDVL